MRANYGATEYGRVGIESAIAAADPHELISILFEQLKKELVAAEYHHKAENFENFSLRNFKIHAAFDRQELYDIKISNGKNYKLFDDLSFNKETKIKYPTSKY